VLGVIDIGIKGSREVNEEGEGNEKKGKLGREAFTSLVSAAQHFC
jgi:hypothetical protein